MFNQLTSLCSGEANNPSVITQNYEEKDYINFMDERGVPASWAVADDRRGRPARTRNVHK